MKYFILLLAIQCALFTDIASCTHASGTDRPTENEAVLKNVLSELKEIREKNVQMENRLNFAGKQIEELQSANTILQQTVAELADHCDSMTVQNNDANSQDTNGSFIRTPIVQIKQARQIHGLSVAFTASVSKSILSGLEAHQTIIFDNSITNVGNAYDTTTGIFTAPYTGVYVIVVRGMEAPGQYMHLALIKDGQTVGIILFDGIKGYHLAQSELWTLELTKGSEVWVRNNIAGSLRGDDHSSFSGFLLYTME